MFFFNAHLKVPENDNNRCPTFGKYLSIPAKNMCQNGMRIQVKHEKYNPQEDDKSQ